MQPSSGSSSSQPAAPSSAAPASASATQAASPAGSAGPGTDIGLTATTIKVGIIADVNNPLVPGLFQNSVNAVKAWAKDVNASGGLAGRKVVVDFCDSQLNPNATTNCVIKACQNDFALVGTSANALEDLSDIDGCKNSAGQPVGIANLAAFAFPPGSCDRTHTSRPASAPTARRRSKTRQTYKVPVGDARYFTRTTRAARHLDVRHRRPDVQDHPDALFQAKATSASRRTARASTR